MLKCKSYFYCACLGFVIFPSVISTSCSNDESSSENDSIKNEEISSPGNDVIDDILVTDDDIKLKIKWKQGFRNEKNIFFNSPDFFTFKLGEIILEQDEFQIQYVGHDNNIPCFTLFDKTIKKYYLSEVNCSYEKLIKIWSKSRLKEHIYTNLIQSYKSEMIINHNISDDDFFVPVDTSDNSLIFEKNDLIWFESSWNVWNKQSGNSIFNININSNKIREILFGPLEQNYDNLIIKNVNATDLYILPKIIVMDTPIKYFNFNINDIKDVDNNKNYELSLDEKSKINIDVPGINDNKYLNWVGMVYNKVLSGIVMDNNYIGGISSTLKNIINSNINDYGDVLSKINASNRPLVEKYVDDIIKKGKKISINISKKYVENDELIKLNINSSIYSGANSSSLIADGSHVGIYDISCIQKMNINFIEYKKF